MAKSRPRDDGKRAQGPPAGGNLKKIQGFYAWKGLMSSPFNYKVSEDDKSLKFKVWEEGRWANKVRQEKHPSVGLRVERPWKLRASLREGLQLVVRWATRDDRHHVASNTGLGAGREVRWAGVPASKPLCQGKETTTPSKGPLRFVPS